MLKPDTFQSLKPGDIITLKDEETILILMKDKTDNAANGLDATIHRIRRFKDQDNIAEWILYELEAPEPYGNLFLLAKIVDQELDVRVYSEPDDYKAGSRRDLIDAEQYWLFKEPVDENFVPSDLEFSDVIDQKIDGEMVKYEIKGGTLYGEYTEQPDGVEPEFAAITEWLANTECQNPEIICFELGGLDEDGDPVADGGFVMFLQGANIGVNDIEIMPI